MESTSDSDSGINFTAYAWPGEFGFDKGLDPDGLNLNAHEWPEVNFTAYAWHDDWGLDKPRDHSFLQLYFLCAAVSITAVAIVFYLITSDQSKVWEERQRASANREERRNDVVV